MICRVLFSYSGQYYVVQMCSWLVVSSEKYKLTKLVLEQTRQTNTQYAILAFYQVRGSEPGVTPLGNSRRRRNICYLQEGTSKTKSRKLEKIILELKGYILATKNVKYYLHLHLLNGYSSESSSKQRFLTWHLERRSKKNRARFKCWDDHSGSPGK